MHPWERRRPRCMGLFEWKSIAPSAAPTQQAPHRRGGALLLVSGRRTGWWERRKPRCIGLFEGKVIAPSGAPTQQAPHRRGGALLLVWVRTMHRLVGAAEAAMHWTIRGEGDRAFRCSHPASSSPPRRRALAGVGADDAQVGGSGGSRDALDHSGGRASRLPALPPGTFPTSAGRKFSTCCAGPGRNGVGVPLAQSAWPLP